MNHANFCLGVFKCLETPTKKECVKLVHYFYGDFSIKITHHNNDILIVLRDTSKLWIEDLTEELILHSSIEILKITEWKSEDLPWEDRNSTKDRSKGENRSDDQP